MQRRLSAYLVIGGVVLVAGLTYAVTRSAGGEHTTRPHTGAISGRVLTAEGHHVPRANVYALTDEGMTGRMPIFVTDEDGKFIIKGLIPGTYKVYASKEEEGYPPTDNTFYSAGLVAESQVFAEGQHTSSGVVVYVGPKSAKINGEIVDATTGKPVRGQQGVQMSLRRTGYPDSSLSTGPDLKGRFEVLVPPAPFTVEVSAPGYRKRHLGSFSLAGGEVRRLDISLIPEK